MVPTVLSTLLCQAAARRASVVAASARLLRSSGGRGDHSNVSLRPSYNATAVATCVSNAVPSCDMMTAARRCQGSYPRSCCHYKQTKKTWSIGTYRRGAFYSAIKLHDFFIFSDRLLNILLAMYLVSNKVASNPAKITVFLHLSYN